MPTFCVTRKRTKSIYNDRDQSGCGMVLTSSLRIQMARWVNFLIYILVTSENATNPLYLVHVQ